MAYGLSRLLSGSANTIWQFKKWIDVAFSPNVDMPVVTVRQTKTDRPDGPQVGEKF